MGSLSRAIRLKLVQNRQKLVCFNQVENIVIDVIAPFVKPLLRDYELSLSVHPVDNIPKRQRGGQLAQSRHLPTRVRRWMDG